MKLLIDKSGEGTDDGGYIPFAQASLYFDAMGVSDDALREALEKLLNYRLIEPFDASSYSLGSEQRLAITHSGRMHYEMALSDPVYVGQMAFASPIRSPSVVDRLRAIKRGKMANPEWDAVRRTFILYCIAQDRSFARVPRDEMYKGQRQLRQDLVGQWSALSGVDTARDMEAFPETRSRTAVSHASGVVKWFDPIKGFGFVDAGLGKDVFLHISTVEKSGLDTIDVGDTVLCDIASGGENRLQVIRIHSVDRLALVKSGEVEVCPGEVLFYNPINGFGFLKVEGFEEDIYISSGVLKKAGVPILRQGDHVSVSVSAIAPGRGRYAVSIATPT